MTRDIVPFRPRRLSRAAIKQWLDANGASGLEQVHLQAVLQVPEITIEEVSRELREHPNLFRMTADGRWQATPERAFIVYPRKPVLRRPRKTPVAKRTTARTTKTPTGKPTPQSKREPPAPPSMDPFFVQDGRLVSLVFRRDVQDRGQPYESGGHLLVPVPQDADVSEAVRAAIMAACTEAAEVQVYEASAGGEWIFRGTRSLLQASETPDGTRIHLVFAAALDDEGRQHALALRAGISGLLPSGMTRALVTASPRETIAEAEQVPAPLKKLLALPPGRRKVDRKVAYERARTLLQAAKNDPANHWPKFRDWLIQKKPEYDVELLEGILTMALNTGCDAIGCFHLARMILNERKAQTVPFARTYCVALARTRNADAIAWASTLLGKAHEAGPADAELNGAIARIEVAQRNFTAACAAFGEVLADPTSPADVELVEDYMLAAYTCNNRAAKRAALKHLDRIVQRCKSATDMNEYMQALQLACDIEEAFGSRPVERIEQLLQLLVATNEADALKEYETRFAGRGVKPSEKLRALSVLEDCETPEAVGFLHRELVSAVRATFDQPSLETIAEAIAQLRYVEAAVGDGDHEGSDGFETQLRERIAGAGPRATKAPARRQTIDGKLVLLVGGRGATRKRAADELMRLGAAAVREVPPSWEQHVDENTILAKAAKADVVATLTDFMKHDAYAIVRELQRAKLDFQLVQTAGGPSRIVRDILAAL